MVKQRNRQTDKQWNKEGMDDHPLSVSVTSCYVCWTQTKVKFLKAFISFHLDFLLPTFLSIFPFSIYIPFSQRFFLSKFAFHLYFFLLTFMYLFLYYFYSIVFIYVFLSIKISSYLHFFLSSLPFSVHFFLSYFPFFVHFFLFLS